MKSSFSFLATSLASFFLFACSSGGTSGGPLDGGAGFGNTSGAGAKPGSGGVGATGATGAVGGSGATGNGGSSFGGSAGSAAGGQAGAAAGGSGGGENCTVCPKGCVDLDNDPNNCGSCGYACQVSVAGAKPICQAGQCQETYIAANETICGSSCVDTATDATNCGGCDQYCDAPSGGGAVVCAGGKCQASCGSGNTLCGSSCVSLAANNYNCGACGNDCTKLPTPTGGSPYTCQAGKCSTTCPSGKTLCNDKCVSLTTDNLNCGSCGYTCGGNFACSSGKCSTSQCAYVGCYVDNQYSSGTHLECCDANESCKFFWLNDINGVPQKHYYCGTG